MTNHKTTVNTPSSDGTRFGFSCESCRGEWVYDNASEAAAHAAQHERNQTATRWMMPGDSLMHHNPAA